jgi:penicillin-binding protein A
VLAAATWAFTAAAAGLYLLTRRRLLRSPGGSGLAATALVCALAVAGFALTQAGVHASWTGRPRLTDIDWAAYGIVFGAALAASQLLLRRARRRVDPLVLPVAAFLALLGLLNLYAWELRDANAYVSTEALPALRSSGLELGVIPNELDYERPREGRYATVLDDGWRRAVETAIRRYGEVRPAGAPTVRGLRLGDGVRRQLAALVLALLAAPLFLLVVERLPVRRLALDPRGPPVAGGALLALVAAALLTTRNGELPALLTVGGHTVTLYELLKLALVGVLAVALRRGARNRQAQVALAAAALALALLAWRDPGAGIALAAVAAVATTLVAGPRLRLGLVAAVVVAVAAAPAAVRGLDEHLPQTVRLRVGMWTDPWGAYERAAIENDVRRSLTRVASYRHASPPAARRPSAVGAPVPPVHRDANRIEQELRWRIAALERRRDAPQPLIPREDPADELLLLEAERLWAELGGFGRGARNGGLAALRIRLDYAIRRLQSDADRLRLALGEHPRRTEMAPAPDNFQLQRAVYALRRGGVLGTGLGRGRPEAVPGLTEDVPLAGLGEALGFAGVLVTALFVLLFAGRGVELALGRALPAAILAAGLGSVLGLQALISIGGMTGVLPFTGLSFPFVSRSGTGLVVNVLAVVLLAGVAATAPRPAARPRLGGAGLPVAFAIVLSTVGTAQLAGRTLTHGTPLQHLPSDDSPFLHARDQWTVPDYRAAPGPIVDREGRVLARTDALGAARSYPDGVAAFALGHTLLQLDLALRDELLRSGSRPLVGAPLRTTVDARVQKAVHAAIDRGAVEAGIADVDALRGAVVLLDVRDGGIVAIESRPSFSVAELSEPAAWARAEARERRAGFAYRYLNRAVAGYYPPGSIFKTVTAAAALERGLHELHSRDFDYREGPTGPRRADGLDQLGTLHQLPLHRAPPITDGNHPHLDHWVFDLEEAFAWSCNVAFAQIGLELGPADLVGFARRFGLERRLAVRGLGSSLSTLDNDARKPVSERFVARNASNLARTAFGQGEARVTPLQMALVPAAIANGGTLMRPRVLASERPRPLVDTGLSAATVADLRELMWASATYGWARTARVNPNNAAPGVAGKTGSAEWSETLDAAHAWFIGYFPAERPRLALAIVVERGGSGPTTAARIARWIFAADAVQEYAR